MPARIRKIRHRARPPMEGERQFYIEPMNEKQAMYLAEALKIAIAHYHTERSRLGAPWTDTEFEERLLKNLMGALKDE